MDTFVRKGIAWKREMINLINLLQQARYDEPERERGGVYPLRIYIIHMYIAMVHTTSLRS